MPDRTGSPAGRSASSGRRRTSQILVLVLGVLALLALVVPAAQSQIVLPPPAVAPPAPAPAPFPTSAPGQIGTGTPPQNIFYVSPQGCDPAPGSTTCPLPATPNLACASTAPCLTIPFALSQARDGDALSLAGGEYDITNPIEVNKLVTIAPNGFAAGSTNTAQAPSTVFANCTLTAVVGPSAPGSCVATLGVAVLAGSSLTITVTAASGNTVRIDSVFPPLGTTPGCPLTAPSTLPTAIGPVDILTFTCPPGQSIAIGTPLTVNITVFGSNATAPAPPSETITVTGPTASVRPVIESCALIARTAPTCVGQGGTIFRVTAVGSAALHATIFGLTLGNAANLGGPAAIILDNDSYTEIAKNIIGSEDLPNAIGILLTASDHPIIHDNTIQGSTLFPRTATIAIGPGATGYGVVTAECLGSINHSNGVQLINNLFAKNSNAGAWFCSNGTGGAFVSQNTIRANGRGIVLLDAVDMFVSGNTIGDNVLDGIDVLQTSERNLISGNIIESQQSENSAGILLAANQEFLPLGNQISQNQIRRNTVDILIVGAQGTRITNNSITAVGTNTGVLFALAIPGLSAGQPINTFFVGNALQASGDCSATTGCAIRLTQGVIVPVDATGGNDFGVLDPTVIQSQIWDSGRDPALGTVFILAAIPLATPSGILGLTPSPTPTSSPAGVAPVGGATGPVVATPVTSTPSPAPTPSPTPSPSPSPSPSPTAVPTRIASAPAGVATAYQDPTTGSYYVVLSFSVTNPAGIPVANDALLITFYAADGTSLGSTTDATDGAGRFSGAIQPRGSGRLTQPAQIVIGDVTGASLMYAVTAGSPLAQPPPGPIQ